MNRKVFILLLNLLFCCVCVSAETVQKSDMQQRAEAEYEKGSYINARALYIRAFDEYARQGHLQQGVECGVKATALYYRENMYKEAFELLRRIDQTIEGVGQSSSVAKAGMHYLTAKERMQMYMKLRKGANVQEQITNMERLANLSGDEGLKDDLLYNKAIYYYTFGQNEKGNAVFKEMAAKLTAQKEYDKVDEVYRTLIANGRRSNSASLVAQSYSSYVAWKDSVSALKVADEIGALKKKIADDEATISDLEGSLAARWATIIALGILAIVLAVVLVVGSGILLRYMALTRKQKKTINLLNDNNALKAKFIGNISAQLDPTLQKLDKRTPEVKALLDFSQHIQTLAELENSDGETLEMEDTQIPPFCEGLMEEVRTKSRKELNFVVNAPKMSVGMNKEYVSHILLHLLNNAVEYTPEGGKVTLEYKKRGAHKHQFLVTNTGCGIPEEKREDVFKPFLEIRDLTTGDGLGLPICKQMALKMKGDLEIDPEYTKGTRFVLDLYA